MIGSRKKEKMALPGVWVLSLLSRGEGREGTRDRGEGERLLLRPGFQDDCTLPLLSDLLPLPFRRVSSVSGSSAGADVSTSRPREARQTQARRPRVDSVSCRVGKPRPAVPGTPAVRPRGPPVALGARVTAPAAVLAVVTSLVGVEVASFTGSGSTAAVGEGRGGGGASQTVKGGRVGSGD